MTASRAKAIGVRRWFAPLRFGALGLAGLAMVGSLLAGPTTTAGAEPPLTIEGAKAQIADLETEAAAIDQEYVGVRESLKQSKKALKAKKADLAAQHKKVAHLKRQAGQVALAQFQNRQLDPATQLLLGDGSDDSISQVATVEKVSENQHSALQDYQEELAKLSGMERATETQTLQLTQDQAALDKLRAESDGKVAESKQVLAQLTVAQRQQIAAEQQQESSAAQSAADAVSSADLSGPAAGKGAVALAFAKSQLGKPYRFGAAGPGAYDCSGLTSRAWAKAGVSLPRTSQSQFGAGSPVARADLKPGDLVFFYGDLSHVGLYAGNGQIIHAPRPGKSVEYASLSSMPYAGARRPG